MSTITDLDIARVNLCLNAERQLLAQNASKRYLPVTVVTGFLGAGKTSLLQHLLQHQLNLHMACIISDLAEINIDALLVTTEWNPSSNTLIKLKSESTNYVDAFKDAIWQILTKQNDDVTRLSDQVDYLVIETSGTMNPTQLVAAIQEKCGKMTRARLDSVITVVDGDAVAQDAANAIAPCLVALQQLQCADVVLLNKVDLLTEDNLKTVRQIIQQYAPNARVYETNHSRVYLPHVLDITPPEDGGVSHERVQAQWNTGLSALSNALLPAPSRLRVKHGERMELMDTTVSMEAFESVAFEHTTPISLAALHEWIQHQLPQGTLRAKGVIYIAELPRYRFVLHLSGKRRVEVENTGVWKSTPKTQFVVIGVSNSSRSGEKEYFDKVEALDSLTTCLLRTTDQLKEDKRSIRAAIVTKLQASELYDAMVISEQATTIAFRLKCPTSRMNETMLRHHHHVNMNELTKQLVRDVNASGGGSLLLYASNLSERHETEGDQVYAIASIIGTASILSMWNELNACAELIIDEVRAKMAGCLCGF